MTNSRESFPAATVESVLADEVASSASYQRLAPGLLRIMKGSVEDTLTYGNDHILDAAQRLDDTNVEVLGKLEAGNTPVHGKLIDVYRRHLESPMSIFAEDPEAAEEYARLLVQKQYAIRWFTVDYTTTECQTVEDAERFMNSDEYFDAVALVSTLVTKCRLEPEHIPAFLWGVV